MITAISNNFVTMMTEDFNHFYEWSKPSIPINDIAKEIAKTGFWFSAAICAIVAPLVLISALAVVWNLALVGKVRKTLSTILICCLYPFITHYL
jgi:hypothetical protein